MNEGFTPLRWQHPSNREVNEFWFDDRFPGGLVFADSRNWLKTCLLETIDTIFKLKNIFFYEKLDCFVTVSTLTYTDRGMHVIQGYCNNVSLFRLQGSNISLYPTPPIRLLVLLLLVLSPKNEPTSYLRKLDHYSVCRFSHHNTCSRGQKDSISKDP